MNNQSCNHQTIVLFVQQPCIQKIQDTIGSFFFFFTPSLSNAGALFQADSTVNTFNNSLQTFTLEYTLGVMIVAFFLFLRKSLRELHSMH